jgi:hypothetical protein
MAELLERAFKEAQKLSDYLHKDDLKIALLTSDKLDKFLSLI